MLGHDASASVCDEAALGAGAAGAGAGAAAAAGQMSEQFP